MSSIKYFIELNFYPVLCSSPLQLQKIAEQSIIGFDALYNFLYWKIRTKISLIKKTQNPVNNVPLVTEWRYRIKRRDRHEMKKEGGFPPNVKTLLERVLLNVIWMLFIPKLNAWKASVGSSASEKIGLGVSLAVRHCGCDQFNHIGTFQFSHLKSYCSSTHPCEKICG
jgi:hypothetical protein